MADHRPLVAVVQHPLPVPRVRLEATLADRLGNMGLEHWLGCFVVYGVCVVVCVWWCVCGVDLGGSRLELQLTEPVLNEVAVGQAAPAVYTWYVRALSETAPVKWRDAEWRYG